MSRVRLNGVNLSAGARFSMRLERTVRVPNDGRRYHLPPSLGPLPVYRTRDFPVTRSAAQRGEYLAPLYPWEAFWIRFEAEGWKPNAVQVAVGGVNVLTGEARPSPPAAEPQNYLVCPPQDWLDGIRTEAGTVRQFVAARPGAGLTVEEQLTGSSARGGLQIRVFEPRRGVFPARKPKGWRDNRYDELPMAGEMGIAGGGAIEQRVYPDPYGLDSWDAGNFHDIRILILSSEVFRSVIGQQPPPSPITAADYERAGLPWFRLEDEELGDLGATEKLQHLKTVNRRDPSVEAKIVRTTRRSGGRRPRKAT